MKHTIARIEACLTPLRHQVSRRIPVRSGWLAIALGLLLPFAAARAHHVEDVCMRSDGGSDNARVNIPVTVNLGLDAAGIQEGEAFGPWFSYTLTWTCIRTPMPDNKNSYKPDNDYFEVRTEIRPYSVKDKGGFLADPNFHVYQDGTQNFGFIAKFTQAIGGGPEQTTYLNTAVGTDVVTTFADGYARRHGDVSTFRLTLQVRLVKLHGTKTPPPNFDIIRVRFRSISRHPDATPNWTTQSSYLNRLNVAINDVGAACTTPAVNVPLGTADGGKLRNVNDAGPIQPFALRFENCPPYMGSVEYRFQSVPLQAISNGTLPLDPVLSTASGVGVQVLNADDTPLAFDDAYIPLTAYDAANPSPLYLVPMKARIIRTPGALQGGSVHAAMKMLVRYR